jgi:hypothetical protein
MVDSIENEKLDDIVIESRHDQSMPVPQALLIDFDDEAASTRRLVQQPLSPVVSLQGNDSFGGNLKHLMNQTSSMVFEDDLAIVDRILEQAMLDNQELLPQPLPYVSSTKSNSSHLLITLDDFHAEKEICDESEDDEIKNG